MLEPIYGVIIPVKSLFDVWELQEQKKDKNKNDPALSIYLGLDQMTLNLLLMPGMGLPMMHCFIFPYLFFFSLTMFLYTILHLIIICH